VRQRRRKSRRGWFVLAATCLLLGAVALPATAVAGSPAEDQYTVNLPTPHGQKPTGAQQPVSHPNTLTPAQQQAASGPDSTQLTQIATSPQLGAPATTQSKNSGHSSSGGASSGQSGSGGHDSGTGTRVDLAGTTPSVPAAVTNTVGKGPVLGLLAVLVAIAAAGAVSVFLRRRGFGR
jgi:hypothetical protein